MRGVCLAPPGCSPFVEGGGCLSKGEVMHCLLREGGGFSLREGAIRCSQLEVVHLPVSVLSHQAWHSRWAYIVIGSTMILNKYELHVGKSRIKITNFEARKNTGGCIHCCDLCTSQLQLHRCSS